MAKAREIAGLSADQSYGEAAARIVAVRAEELASHRDGVLDTRDIDGVHDMRVATRRLRAALEVFEPCFPSKPYRRALRAVKALADGLGERRDRDVAIFSLERFKGQMHAADRPGVESLIEVLRAEQLEANAELAPMVADEPMAELLEALAELVEEAAGREEP